MDSLKECFRESLRIMEQFDELARHNVSKVVDAIYEREFLKKQAIDVLTRIHYDLSVDDLDKALNDLAMAEAVSTLGFEYSLPPLNVKLYRLPNESVYKPKLPPTLGEYEPDVLEFFKYHPNIIETFTRTYDIPAHILRKVLCKERSAE